MRTVSWLLLLLLLDVGVTQGKVKDVFLTRELSYYTCLNSWGPRRACRQEEAPELRSLTLFMEHSPLPTLRRCPICQIKA